MAKVKCKECEFNEGSYCKVDDIRNEFTDELETFTGKEKNKTGDCPKFKKVGK